MIYVYRDEVVQGPFQRLEVLEHLREGKFADDDSACLEGSEEWQPLARLLVAIPLPVTLAETPVLAVDAATNDRCRWLTTALAALVLFGACTVAVYLAGGRWYTRAPRLTAWKRGVDGTVTPANPALSPTLAEGMTFEKPAEADADVSRNAAAEVVLKTGPTVALSAAPSEAGPASGHTAGPVSVTAAATPASAQPTYLRASFNASAPPQIQTVAPHDLFQTPFISAQELGQVLETRFSTAPLNPPPNPADTTRGKVTVEHGSFILETSLRWNPRVEVIYSIPLYNNATPLPRASNVIMLGFYPKSMAPPPPVVVNGKEVPGESKLYGALDHYAHKFGFTAFTMHIVTENFHDPKETYFLGGPEWTDVVFRAQDEITRKFRLLPRKLMLEGMSLGATFVERIAAGRPERVAAVAFHSAPEITVPKTATDTLWYMQITRGDSMQAAYNELYNGLLKLDDRVLFDILPPDYKSRGVGNLYHTESQLAKDAADAFLDGVATRRDSAGNIDPEQWPYARRRSNPITILSKVSLDSARVPRGDLEFLPSEQFVRCLQNLPVRVQAINLPTPGGHPVKCYVGLPPLGHIRGVLIYAPENVYTDITGLFDDVYFLAQKGYVVLCPYARGSNLSTAIVAALNCQQTIPALKDIPTVFVGAGESGRCLWETIPHSGVEPRAIAMLNFKPRQAFDETHLPVGARPIRCPVFFIEEEKSLLSVNTASQAREALDNTQKIDAYVELCRGRHQMARTVLVSDSENTNAYDAQKSIEAVNNAFGDIVDGHRGFIVR